MLFALEEFHRRNISCALIWVDYTSIPQSNVFLQQAAINSLSVYASYSSVFLTVVPNDDGEEGVLDSYSQRSWCRLELLSFKACSWSDERESYVCDGSLGPSFTKVKHLWPLSGLFRLIIRLSLAICVALNTWNIPTVYESCPSIISMLPTRHPQAFFDGQHGHVGGDVFGCAWRKFQLLHSNLVPKNLEQLWNKYSNICNSQTSMFLMRTKY